MKKALSIAGSDCSGGAGIQADIKTMSANGVYAMSVISALTAQNTTGIFDVVDVSAEFMEEQMDAVFQDIFPDAVKLGMLPNDEIMKIVAGKLIEYRAKNIVIDPVMISSSGTRLMKDEAFKYIQEELFPIARVITPNIPETEALTGEAITCLEDMILVGRKLYNTIATRKNELVKKLLTEPEGANQHEIIEMYKVDTGVLVKGGHSIEGANDVLVTKNKEIVFQGEKIDNPNTHGTGCTLSSAIASNLAKDYDIEQAVQEAKNYLTKIIKAGLNLGKGSGPLNHFI